MEKIPAMDLAFTRRRNARSIVYVKADVCNCELPPPKKNLFRSWRTAPRLSLPALVRSPERFVRFPCFSVFFALRLCAELREEVQGF